MSLAKAYRDFLTRTDHPALKKDFPDSVDGESSFNLIFNELLARQLEKIRLDVLKYKRSQFPQTADMDSIDQWEETYFNFTKPTTGLEDRIEELMLKRNSRIRMRVKDVKDLSQSITGKVPTVLRSLAQAGWILDVSVLDVDTVLSGEITLDDSQTYVLLFDDPIDSALMDRLDKALTNIEKAGSRHVIIAPLKMWVLDESSLDVDTIME